MTNNQKDLELLTNELNVKHEYDLQRLAFIKSKFPDAKGVLSTNHSKKDNIKFLSRSVNNNYKKIKFQDNWSSLLVRVFDEIEYEHNGKTEIIKVHSLPDTSQICHTICYEKYNYSVSPAAPFIPRKFVKTICFSKFPLNMKHNNFDEELLSQCRQACLEFIKNHSGYELDTKLLEPRLQNLLLLL